MLHVDLEAVYGVAVECGARFGLDDRLLGYAVGTRCVGFDAYCRIKQYPVTDDTHLFAFGAKWVFGVCVSVNTSDDQLPYAVTVADLAEAKDRFASAAAAYGVTGEPALYIKFA